MYAEQFKQASKTSKRIVPVLIKRAQSPRNRRKVCMQAIRHTRKLVGTYGAGNCWGTTLWMLGRLEELTDVDANEMEQFLQDKTALVSRPAFGDVLVIHSEETDVCGDCYTCHETHGESCDNLGLQHTAIYIGEGMYWHQRGFYGPWLIQPLEDITDTYQGEVTHRRVIAE